jgi:hypothetical protein
MFVYVEKLQRVFNFVRVIKPAKMIWAGYVARIGEMINAHKIFVGKPESMRPQL